MTPLAPWERPTIPHPRDRERRMMWWSRAAWLALMAVVFVVGVML